MAGTKARLRDSHRDRRPPSAFLSSSPNKDTTLTESELAGSERGGSGLEEGEAQEEGEDPESFTGIRSMETDTESEDPTPGGSPGGAPVAGRWCLSPPPARGDGVNAEWTVVAEPPRDPG